MIADSNQFSHSCFASRRGLAVVVVAMLIALVPLAAHAQHALSDFHIEDHLESLPPVPEMETQPGWNTHWHTPGGWWRRGCHELHTSDFGNAPKWIVMAELLALRRDQDGNRVFATLGAGGPSVLESGDLHDEFDAGVRVMVGRALGDWYRLEALYSGSYSWGHTAAVRNVDANALAGTGNLFSPFSDFGNAGAINGLDYNELASIGYTSDLDNFEFNLRRRIKVWPGPWAVSFLLGARVMRIEEQFAYFTTANVPAAQGAINDVQVGTGNTLVGMQLGLQLQYMVVPRGWIDFEIKGVIFANDADQNTFYRNVDENGVTTITRGAAGEQATSYMGDLALMFIYQFTPTFTFRMGYNAMFLEGVAIASENFQSNVNLLRLGPAEIIHNGRVVYHGPTLGLTWSW